MLKKRIKILLLFIRHIMRPAYIFFKYATGFFSCSISRFNISRFTDLKFFKKVIQDEEGAKNKINPRKNLSNYSDIVYENIMMNFNKLGFIDSRSKGFIKDNLSLQEKEIIIREADLICGHRFDLLGSGRVKVDHSLRAAGVEGFIYDNRLTNDEIRAVKEKLGLAIRGIQGIREIREIQSAAQNPDDFSSEYEPIDWHVDFKSGYRWDSKIWYKKIKYGHVPGVDIKIPWELSRGSHLTTLGQAYWLTSDEKYAGEYICQIINWIADNPFKSGVIGHVQWTLPSGHVTGSYLCLSL